MTLPVFDVIPVPSRSALANEPPPAGTQATVIDGNFAKVNTYLSTGLLRASTWSGSTPGVVFADFLADGLWHWYFGWDGFSFTAPSGVSAWLLWLDVAVNPTHGSWVSFSPGWSGSGVTGSGPQVMTTLQPGSGQTGNAASYVILPGSTFIPGGTVTTNMRYQTGQTGRVGLAGTYGITAL